MPRARLVASGRGAHLPVIIEVLGNRVQLTRSDFLVQLKINFAPEDGQLFYGRQSGYASLYTILRLRDYAGAAREATRGRGGLAARPRSRPV
jgi:hypothetical protein